MWSKSGLFPVYSDYESTEMAQNYHKNWVIEGQM